MLHQAAASLRRFVLAAATLAAAAAHAEGAPDPRQAWDDAAKAAQTGPAEIKLLDQAVLKLPEGRVFVPQPQATRLLQAMGNPGEDPRLQGLVFPKGDDQGWFMTVRYEDSGHIKDDDAKEWNADDLLKSYKEGTEASNEERVKLGVPAIEIIGWAEKPAYDAATHRLVWAMSSREKGERVASAEDGQGVNYNTYLLGREGYFSMNLVTGLKELPQHKPEGQAMLAALAFNDGKRYGDFDEKTDHVAEYGLAALVLGVGAKKLGLLAMAGVFFAKFAKLIILGVVGVGAAAAKLLGRKSKTTA
ncbi:DUF2167 domain-containing protein [Ideonella sp.]|uniref:DUF2167 domain-containing protein n=1 Tax=Ideonella sp. TaxID=1929293 RepID=UPI002B49112E|nr:DUF2167 domain-containing protein [Ideonella sp.]HJV69995.1 DUF2167 domain-containing protein [Ideonella sp.]